MAKAAINLQKESGGIVKISPVDGIGITEVTVPESGELVTKEYVDSLKTIASGTATFDSTTNNINLIGIGIGVEIGDVIQISGADDAKNNSEFTVEVITDDNNIIVNQAHANQSTSKNVVTQVGDTDVTVKLLAKWYNSDFGLGKGWVNVTASRTAGATYPNNTGNAIIVSVMDTSGLGRHFRATISVDGVVCSSNHKEGTATGNTIGVDVIVPKGSTYIFNNIGTSIFTDWLELR